MQKSYATYAERTKFIKENLKKSFPKYKFSVTKNTGTASHWIYVTWDDNYQYSVKESNQISDIIEKHIIMVTENTPYEVSTFLSDDGYNSEYHCLNVYVKDGYNMIRYDKERTAGE
jgi:hypothetical protein